MPDFSLLILYVDDPAASAAFYARLFGVDPLEASPTFVLLQLPAGPRLGLWSRHTVEPAATGAGGGGGGGGGGSEIAFVAADVDALHADWAGRGLSILQTPTDLDFGRSFVALDPDGHRLRAYLPNAGED